MKQITIPMIGVIKACHTDRPQITGAAIFNRKDEGCYINVYPTCHKSALVVEYGFYDIKGGFWGQEFFIAKKRSVKL